MARGDPLPLDPAILSQLAGHRQMSTITGGPVPTSEERFAATKPLLDLFMSMAPVVGDVRDVGEFVTGYDAFGEKLGNLERLVTGVATVLPIMPGMVRKLIPKAPKMSASLNDIYAKVLESLPENIRSRIRVKAIKMGKFPAENEGEGGRLVMGGKMTETPSHYIALESGQSPEDLAEVLRHELVHSYVLDNPQLTRGGGLHSEENAVELILKEIK